MELLKHTKHTIAPDPRDLWERGGATIETTTIEEGRQEDVPFFHASRIDSLQPHAHTKDIYRADELIGTRIGYRVEMTTGISRDAFIYLPPLEKRLEAAVTIHMDTPWMTGVKGHNDKIAESFMHHTSQPVIMVGPEHIPAHKDVLYIARHLGQVATDASKLSLALAAQDSMQVASVLAGEQLLPRMFVEVGESRGAMLAPAKQPHAAHEDVNIVYYDITDPNIAENILLDARTILQLGLFPMRETANLLPVAIDLARRHSLHREIGTVPRSARYLGAAVLGTGPAIFSGESGEFPAYLPASMPVHLVSLKKNPLSQHDKWREKYAHTQFAGVNLNAAHLGLAYSSIQRHVIERINRFVTELNTQAGQVMAIDLRRVHLTDDQALLGPDEHMPGVE